jgi:hypothetical protein
MEEEELEREDKKTKAEERTEDEKEEYKAKNKFTV